MIFMNVGLGLAALLIWSSSAKATNLLNTAVNESIKTNLELKALDAELSGARERARFATSWSDPDVEFSVSEKSEPEGATRFGGFGISQRIPRLGFSRSLQRLGAETGRETELERETAEIQLRARLVTLLYRCKSASEKSDHAKERVQRFKTVSVYLNSRTFASPQKAAEALIVRTKLISLNQVARKLDAEKAACESQLALHGLPNEPGRLSWRETAPNLDEDSFLPRARQQNPEIRHANALVELRKAERENGDFANWEGMTFKASANNGTGQTPERNFGLGVSFPIPLFGVNRASTAALRAAQSSAEARAQWQTKKIESEVLAALSVYHAAAAGLRDFSRSSVSELENAMRKIDGEFKRGSIDLVTYIEADSQHFETINSFFDQQLDLGESLATVLYFVGEAPTLQEN